MKIGMLILVLTFGPPLIAASAMFVWITSSVDRMNSASTFLRNNDGLLIVALLTISAIATTIACIKIRKFLLNRATQN